MKTKYLFLGLAALSLASCDDYLDKLPDDRATLDTKEKITQLITSAYPANHVAVMAEISSDNVGNNGNSYGVDQLVDELYQFKDVKSTAGNDCPNTVWNGYYTSVATANEAIKAIKEYGDSAALAPQLAEAKLCRAYSMMQLASVFCMAWNPEKADEYLGLAYPLEPEKSVNDTYKRGTLRELYANINRDIEEALPAVDDGIYSVPKYHWNSKAAYAFAARFNLYYMNYDKAINYATRALGADVASQLFDFPSIMQLGAQDIGKTVIRSGLKSNYLLITAYSSGARFLNMGYTSRYAHNSMVASYDTYWARAPWGQGSSDNTLYFSTKIYGTSACAAFPTMIEHFEVTDRINLTGYAHIVDHAFTGDETLLVRAEAYALKNDTANALKDMNMWVVSHCKEKEGSTVRPVLTTAVVDTFFTNMEYQPAVLDGPRDYSIRKQLHPQGFTLQQPYTTSYGVEVNTQENLILLILHMRRLDTLFQGLRFYDLKRYGMEYTHEISGGEGITFKAGDLRGAIQLPQDVINAGQTANPR